MKRTLFTIALLLICSTGWGATYYMRADGTNADPDCSETSACCAGAMDVSDHNAATFSDGDIIYLCDDGGAFRDQIVFPSNGSSAGITYQPYTGENPVLYGSKDGETLTWTQIGGGHVYKTDDNTFMYGCGMLR